MSDFGELCPLFNTGVYSEVVFPQICMTSLSTSMNALAGTMTYSVTKAGYWRFGRTVVVTEAWVKNGDTVEGAEILFLGIAATGVGTISGFATITISTTITGVSPMYSWQPFTFTASRTFTSTDILTLTCATTTALSAGLYDLMVKYREK